MNKRVKQIIIISIIIAVSTVLYFCFKNDKQEVYTSDFASQFPLLDKTRPLYNEEDLITNVQPLREYLKSLPEANKSWADISIYFEVLNTGSNITVNTDTKIWPASLSKLPVAMVAMKKVQNGQWSLDKPDFIMQEKDADVKHTPEIAQHIGKEFTLDFLLNRLIIESDNTAYNMIVRSFDPEDMDSIPEAVGLDQLVDPDGKMSAKDYTRLLRALYLASYLNPDYSSKLLGLMKDSDFKDFLSAGLPEGVPFAHKWGTYVERNVFADSGIVYLENRPYMISVMIQAESGDSTVNEERASALMREVGKKTYEFMSDANK